MTTDSNNHITLANDINVSSTLSGNFKAILDGNGHTITLTTQNISLFSTIEGGTVKNLTIDATNDVTNPVLINEGTNHFGILAGVAKSNATIENCTNLVNITCDPDVIVTNLGGLVGVANNCSISNCSNSGNLVVNATNVGGVLGQGSSITDLSSCYNYGNITISSSSATVYTKNCGGIAGSFSSMSNSDLYITNCHNQGSINIDLASSVESYIGGIVGQLPCNIKNCSNSGDITCSTTANIEKHIGGIAGTYNVTTVTKNMYNCQNEGNITAVDDVKKMIVGGLLGENKRMIIKNCYVYGNIEGTNVAGIVYKGIDLYDNVAISNCYFYGTITCSTSNKYGIAGTSYSNKKFLIDHCYYPSGYNLCYSVGDNASTDNGNNATLRNATTLTNDSSLATALHNNLPNMPAGSYDWQNSTSGPAHVVFVTGSK